MVGKVLREIPRLTDRQDRNRWALWKKAPVLAKRCRAWRHGMGHADGVLRSANLNESIPFGPNNPVTVMRSSFDPMSSAHRRGE